MKWLVGLLAVVLVGLGGAWVRVSQANAQMERARLEAPFKEYAEKHSRNLKYGQIAPDFELADETGRKYRLSEVCQQGKLTLVSGIRPTEDTSIRQLIDLREAYNDLHAKGLEVLALVNASPEVLTDLKTRYAVPFPVLRDEGEKALRTLGVTVQPYSLILDSIRKTLCVYPGMNDRAGVNNLMDKIYLEFTRNRFEIPQQFGKAVSTPISKDRPLILNDLNGKAFSLPLTTPVVVTVLSVSCSSCPTTYEWISEVWMNFPHDKPLLVVFANSSSLTTQWLTVVKRPSLPKVRFLLDPSDLLRRKLGLITYGGAALLDENGEVLKRLNYSDKASYERVFADLLHAD